MAEDFNSLDISALAAKLKDKALTAEDKKQLDSAIWNKVSRIGRRIERLNPQDKDQLKSFRSLLKSLPSSYRRELGEKLDIIKSAETRLFRAERGIDDRSVGDKLKDGLEQGVDNAKNNVKQGAAKLQRNFNLGKRFARMAINKKKNQVKTWVKAKKQGYDNWVDSVDAKINDWVNKAGTALENIENGIREIPANIKNAGTKVFNQMRDSFKAGQARIKARQEALKRRRKQQWNKFKSGVKTTVKGTVMVIGGMAAVVGKGAVWSAKQLRRGWQAGKRIINGIKLPEVKGHPNENSTLLDMANGNLADLKPEQIKNLYNELKKYRDTPSGNKYGDAYYRVSAYSTELLNEIKSKGKDSINDENADKVAAWLEVNKNIQEEVNKNHAVEYDRRNAEIGDFLAERKVETRPDKKGITMTAEEYAPYKAFADQLGMEANASFVRECRDGKFKDAFEAFSDNYKAKGGDKDAKQDVQEEKQKEQENKQAEPQPEQKEEPTPELQPEQNEETSPAPEPAPEATPEPQPEAEEEQAKPSKPMERPRPLEHDADTPAASANDEQQPSSKTRKIQKSKLRKIQELRGVSSPRKPAKQVEMDNRGKFHSTENQSEEAKQIDMAAYYSRTQDRA